MIDLLRETTSLSSWPTDERLQALQRIIPRALVEEILAETGQNPVLCMRLPGWFMVFFVIAMGWCCRDSRNSGIFEPFWPVSLDNLSAPAIIK
ncbi:hypothetical protein CCP4SC76_3380003 [Gammaproteobacteria bacterium]